MASPSFTKCNIRYIKDIKIVGPIFQLRSTNFQLWLPIYICIYSHTLIGAFESMRQICIKYIANIFCIVNMLPNQVAISLVSWACYNVWTLDH